MELMILKYVQDIITHWANDKNFLLIWYLMYILYILLLFYQNNIYIVFHGMLFLLRSINSLNSFFKKYKVYLLYLLFL